MNIRLLFPDGKEKAVTLSYDDGVDTDIRFIELLEKYHMKCTFNINSGHFGAEGSVRKEGEIHFRLPESVVKRLYDHPLCEVATHGYSHPFLDRLPPAQCMLDIITDRQKLEALFGKIIRGHAYPFGTYNDEVVDVLRLAGIVYARTTKEHMSFRIPTDWLRMGSTCHHTNPEFMNLTDQFINGKVGNNDGWLFYLWGHTYEFRRDDNWDLIEKFFEKVAHHDNVWYATNMEVYEYVTAYRSLVYAADGDRIYNPTATNVWVKINKTIVSVPAGQTVTV